LKMRKQVGMKWALGLALLCSGTGYADVAVKDFRQIIASYYAVTGVSRADAGLRELVTRLQTRLPMHGTVEEISNPAVLALTEIAGAFCTRVIQNDAAISDPASRRIHRSVDFRLAPRSIPAATRAAVLRDYAQMFWQREATAEELSHLTELFEESAQAAPQTATGTLLALKTVCTTVASSLSFLVYE
jgi:hypothetical protein